MTRWRRHYLPSGMVFYVPAPECPVTFGTYVAPTRTIPIRSAEQIAADECREGAAAVLAILRGAMTAGTLALEDEAPVAMISGRPSEGRANAVLLARAEPGPSTTNSVPLVSASWRALLSKLAGGLP